MDADNKGEGDFVEWIFASFTFAKVGEWLTTLALDIFYPGWREYLDERHKTVEELFTEQEEKEAKKRERREKT